jgi:hypothetical protein
VNPFFWENTVSHPRSMDPSFTPLKKPKCSHSRMMTKGTGMSIWKMEPPDQYLKPRYLQFITMDYTVKVSTRE